MRDMLLFILYITFACLDFGFAAKNLHDERYMWFGVDLVYGIIFVFSAAALFISKVIV